MENQQIRAALDQHWVVSAAGDLEKEHDIYHDDVVVDYPQSRERICGRHNIQAIRGHHPYKPAGFKVKRIIGNGDLWVTECVITYDK
jgi:ketosteroid isomerase-like protein